jgi:hypothetical protein
MHRVDATPPHLQVNAAFGSTYLGGRLEAQAHGCLLSQ